MSWDMQFKPKIFVSDLLLLVVAVVFSNHTFGDGYCIVMLVRLTVPYLGVLYLEGLSKKVVQKYPTGAALLYMPLISPIFPPPR